MAPIVALILAVVTFLVGTIDASASRTFGLSRSLSVSSPREELILNLNSKADCGDALACPADRVDSVTVPYSNGRSGVLTATYQEDGSLLIKTQGLHGTPIALQQTDLLVGNGVGANCKPSSFLAGQLADTEVTFANCGFTQIVREDVVYREVVVQVRHRFSSPNPANVHIIGGFNVRIRVYLHLKIDTDILPTPVRPSTASVSQCSALNHTIIVEKAVKANRYQFTVIAQNYIPDVIGFELVSCVLRPYNLDNVTISNNPDHEVPLIANGAYVGPQPDLMVQTVTPGRSYSLTIGVYEPASVAGYNHRKSPVVFCSVCLCKITDKDGANDNLKQCAKSVRMSNVSRQLSPFWKIIPDTVQSIGGLETGDVDVVPANNLFF